MPFRGGVEAGESAELHARRLVALFDHLPALVAYWDRDLRNVIANAAYYEWIGLTPEQMHGMHIRDVLGAETYAKNLPFLTLALNGEKQFFERTLVAPGGQVRHTQASYVPDNIGGENVGLFVLVTDVTAKVEAQNAMDQAQRLAEVGSWSLDLPSGVLTWSDELYRIFGLHPDGFVPSYEGFLDKVDPRDRAVVDAQVAQARLTGEDYDLIYRIRRADGELRDIHGRGHPLRGPDESVVRLTGTLQDVTATNAAARELSRVNGELLKVNQLNADVLAMLGHDVRSPLAVVLGYLEELSENWEERPEQQRRESVDRAYRAARKLGTLVDDILSMATIESGQIVAHPLKVSVHEQVHEALDGIPGGHGVQVTAAGDPQAFVDAFHLRQLVSNLVRNAMRHGKPPVEIQIDAHLNNTVTLTVSDHGAGVPESQIETLFDRFVVGHSSTGGEGGSPASTGFGLYIAAGLAAANNATLDYDRTGPGARFRLTLPSTRL